MVAVMIMAVLMVQAQDQNAQSMRSRFAVKGGVNFSYIDKTQDKAGFMIGGYYAPSAKFFGFRTELLFSRQSYSYEKNARTGDVALDYIVMPQLMTLNITKFVQLHAGGQIAFLLNAKVDSLPSPSSQPAPAQQKATEFFNRINYGFAGGLEVYPVAGLFVGGRYNLYMNLLDQSNSDSNLPPYVPPYDKGRLKNGQVQVYLGWRF